MPFYVGLDLGQSADYTALAVVQDVTEKNQAGGTEKYLHLRHLERYPLRTLYPDIADAVADLMRHPNLCPEEFDPVKEALRPPRSAARRGQYRRGARCDRPPQKEGSPLSGDHHHWRR